MTVRWLARFFKYADLSTLTLRGMLGIAILVDLLPEQREAIVYELSVRAWAEAVEQRLGSTIAWCRGGRS